MQNPKTMINNDNLLSQTLSPSLPPIVQLRPSHPILFHQPTTLVIYPFPGAVPTLLAKLSFLPNPPSLASSTLCSKKLAHKSASDSFPPPPPPFPAVDRCVGSEKNSLFSAGELGVLWNGEVGRRRLPPLVVPVVVVGWEEVPGRARPAFSRWESFHWSRPAMTWRI